MLPEGSAIEPPRGSRLARRTLEAVARMAVCVRVGLPEDAHLVLVNSWAYPSGHSLTSSAVLGVLSVVVSSRLTARTARLATAAAGVILVVLVGISRIYLGVHWPTDVLAGWLIGAGWLAGCLLVYEALERRRSVGE